jgi:uncharacterized membrane protein YgcG
MNDLNVNYKLQTDYLFCFQFWFCKLDNSGASPWVILTKKIVHIIIIITVTTTTTTSSSSGGGGGGGGSSSSSSSSTGKKVQIKQYM